MKIFFIFMLIMLIFDGIWLSTATPMFYAKRLAGLIGNFKILPAALFYILYSIGVSVFVILPVTFMQLGYWYTFLYGALFGLVAYGTYDLTNQATIPNWPIDVTIVDMTWGALVTGASTALAVWVFKSFF